VGFSVLVVFIQMCSSARVAGVVVMSCGSDLAGLAVGVVYRTEMEKIAPGRDGEEPESDQR
jgi:hypothetical protein